MALTCISWWPEGEVFIAFLLCEECLFYFKECKYAEWVGDDEVLGYNVFSDVRTVPSKS